jgi:adenosylhomocysteine nucleosidase
MKIVVLISADAEWRSLKPLFPQAEVQESPFGEWFNAFSAAQPLTFFHGGWGKISAAATAQYVIDHFQPDLLVNLGTCGGFEGAIDLGTIILVDRTLVYDILEQMGDPDEAIAAYTTRLDLAWLSEPLPGDLQRGLLVSADRDIVVADIPMLTSRFGALAADWESGAIAWVADKNRVRCLILRGVSDLVGREGGEAYGNFELFSQRTDAMMTKLLHQLGALLVMLPADASPSP